MTGAEMLDFNEVQIKKLLNFESTLFFNNNEFRNHFNLTTVIQMKSLITRYDANEKTYKIY